MTSKRAALLHQSIWTSERACGSGKSSQLVYIELLTAADDQGRMSLNARKIKAMIFPLTEDMSVEDIEEALEYMERVKLIFRYSSGEDANLIQLDEWWEHNSGLKLIRASKWPPPDGWVDRKPTPRDDMGRFIR